MERFPLRRSLRFALAVQPGAGQSGNLAGSPVLVSVVVSDVGTPLLPGPRFRERLALGIMMGTMIVVAIGNGKVGRFEVVPPINQRFQLTPVGFVVVGIEDVVQMAPQSALEKVQIVGIGIGGGIILAGFHQCFQLTLGALGLGRMHSEKALELRESRDSTWGFVLVAIVVPDALTPFGPSFERNQGQIEMGWCGEKLTFRLRRGRAGDGNDQSVD